MNGIGNDDFDANTPGEVVHSIWRRTRDKGNIRFYQHEGFRGVYALRNMIAHSGKVIDFLSYDHNIHEDIQPFNGNLTVLSLGCGPGSDLLGFVTSAAMYSANCEMPVRIDAVGVDQCNWTRGSYDSAIENLKNDQPDLFKMLQLQTTFVFGTSMQKFVKDRLDDAITMRQSPKQYNVILLSYADVQQEHTMLFLRWIVAQWILSPGGRIYVIDNNIRNVRRLQDYGFERIERIERIDQNKKPIIYMYEKREENTL